MKEKTRGRREGENEEEEAEQLVGNFHLASSYRGQMFLPPWG